MNERPPTLKHFANWKVEAAPPKNAATTPYGDGMWVEIVGGNITKPDGTHIAKGLPGGGDYITRHIEHQVLEINVRCMAEDESGHIFKFETYGFYHLDEPTMREMSMKYPPTNNPPNPKFQIFGQWNAFEVLRCNTSSPDYLWMNFTPMLGQVRLLIGEKGLEGVELRIYKVENDFEE